MPVVDGSNRLLILRSGSTERRLGECYRVWISGPALFVVSSLAGDVARVRPGVGRVRVPGSAMAGFR